MCRGTSVYVCVYYVHTRRINAYTFEQTQIPNTGKGTTSSWGSAILILQPQYTGTDLHLKHVVIHFNAVKHCNILGQQNFPLSPRFGGDEQFELSLIESVMFPDFQMPTYFVLAASIDWFWLHHVEGSCTNYGVGSCIGQSIYMYDDDCF